MRGDVVDVFLAGSVAGVGWVGLGWVRLGWVEVVVVSWGGWMMMGDDR